MKQASIYKFPDRFIIHSDSLAKIGYSVASPPYLIFDISTPMEKVIQNLQIAMNASKTDVDDVFSKETEKKYLDGMGLKNKKELYKNCILCSVYEKDNILHFGPTVNHGAKGFLNRPDKRELTLPSNASMAELCDTLVETLLLCE